MIKSTIKSAIHAARRVYFNRNVVGNPTIFGKLWQRAANDALRAEMCEYFGVDEEWELPQVVIDNYSSRSHKLNSTFLATQLQTLLGENRITKNVAKEEVGSGTEDNWDCKQVGYLPLTVNDIKTSIGFTSANIQSFDPLLYVKNQFNHCFGTPKTITLPDIDVQDKLDLEWGSFEYYPMLMHRLKPFANGLYMAYLQRTSLVLCSPITSGPVNILLETSFVGAITGMKTDMSDSYIGIKISLDGHLDYVGHVYMSDEVNPELKQIFNQNTYDNAMGALS